MFFGCDIIPKSQIQFKQSITFSCNRCNGIVWFPVCICIDEGLFIGIASPTSENVICQFDQTFFIFYDGYGLQTMAILQFQLPHPHIQESLLESQSVLLPLQMYNVPPGSDHDLR